MFENPYFVEIKNLPKIPNVRNQQALQGKYREETKNKLPLPGMKTAYTEFVAFISNSKIQRWAGTGITSLRATEVLALVSLWPRYSKVVLFSPSTTVKRHETLFKCNDPQATFVSCCVGAWQQNRGADSHMSPSIMRLYYSLMIKSCVC